MPDLLHANIGLRDSKDVSKNPRNKNVNLISAGFPSQRLSILSRFCKFQDSVRNSNGMEARLVPIGSATGSNLSGIGSSNLMLWITVWDY